MVPPIWLPLKVILSVSPSTSSLAYVTVTLVLPLMFTLFQQTWPSVPEPSSTSPRLRITPSVPSRTALPLRVPLSACCVLGLLLTPPVQTLLEQVWPAPQLPQLITSPQPFEMVPQFLPSEPQLPTQLTAFGLAFTQRRFGSELYEHGPLKS